jgi:hypothetical protein
MPLVMVHKAFSARDDNYSSGPGRCVASVCTTLRFLRFLRFLFRSNPILLLIVFSSRFLATLVLLFFLIIITIIITTLKSVLILLPLTMFLIAAHSLRLFRFPLTLVVCFSGCRAARLDFAFSFLRRFVVVTL